MQQILQQFLRSFEQFYEDILPSHGVLLLHWVTIVLPGEIREVARRQQELFEFNQNFIIYFDMM